MCLVNPWIKGLVREPRHVLDIHERRTGSMEVVYRQVRRINYSLTNYKSFDTCIEGRSGCESEMEGR